MQANLRKLTNYKLLDAQQAISLIKSRILLLSKNSFKVHTILSLNPSAGRIKYQKTKISKINRRRQASLLLLTRPTTIKKCHFLKLQIKQTDIKQQGNLIYQIQKLKKKVFNFEVENTLALKKSYEQFLQREIKRCVKTMKKILQASVKYLLILIKLVMEAGNEDRTTNSLFTSIQQTGLDCCNIHSQRNHQKGGLGVIFDQKSIIAFKVIPINEY